MLESSKTPGAVTVVGGMDMVPSTSTVNVADTLSVTVQRAWPVRVVPDVRPVALNVVVADVDASMVMLVPPDAHVHA